jgi:hypothetical protein
MSDFLLATFLFVLYMSFISWLRYEPDNQSTVKSNFSSKISNRNVPSMADYAYAFAVQPDVEPMPVLEQPDLPSKELTNLPDPWDNSITSQPHSSFVEMTYLKDKSTKSLLLLPSAPPCPSQLRPLSTSKRIPSQTGNRFSSMNIRQLKSEALAWNLQHPNLKIKNLGRLSKVQLVERLIALSALSA